MSRVAKKPITLPQGVEVKVEKDCKVIVSGSKVKLEMLLHNLISLDIKDGVITVNPKNNSKVARAMSGTTRANISNMVKGVSEGFKVEMELVGVGYRAKASGDVLNLTLGLSHDVNMKMPAGVKVETPKQNIIVLTGANLQQIKQISADIRKIRPPEPYKGKGIRYVGEVIHIKETKKK